MKLIIHATNVTGLGASQVVVSFLEAFDSLELPYDSVTCYVPASGPVSDFKPQGDLLKIVRYQRRLPKLISRVVECLFPQQCFKSADAYIVLGDIPLRSKSKQLLFVHQSHLVAPDVNQSVSRGLSFRVMRALTRFNSRYVDQAIVQTEAMASGLYRSYPDWERRACIKPVGQPPPNWFNIGPGSVCFENVEEGLRLFYPAASYPHKNHAVFEGLFQLNVKHVIDRLTLTVDQTQFRNAPDWVECVGRLDHVGCLAAYQKAHCLVFPSVLESFGLPLVEAMKMGLPIVVSDLPYARVLCQTEAIYFDPESSTGLLEAIKELQRRLLDGWRPDWSACLANMPSTWEEVAQAFMAELRTS